MPNLKDQLTFDCSNNHVYLKGELTFATCANFLKQSANLFIGREQLVFDLAAVTHSDSAGLALLIEWIREARRANVILHFKNMPRQLIAMAKISGLTSLLGINKDAD